MDELRRIAKRTLNKAPTKSFWEIVRAARITDTEQEVLDMRFIHGKSIVEISIELHYSVEKVNAIIKKSYDKVARLINTR